MGIVLQSTELFSGSIRDNIAYGNKEAKLEDIIEAAKLANAHDFIMALPNEYDTYITNNGEGLSQGQKQLLTIARVSSMNPAIMVLDEATSNIDSRTEKVIKESMDKLMQNRTTFAIAHRLSTIKNSNQILVIQEGEIVSVVTMSNWWLKKVYTNRFIILRLAKRWVNKKFIFGYNSL